jgi:hypothetical protein
MAQVIEPAWCGILDVSGFLYRLLNYVDLLYGGGAILGISGGVGVDC